jgi:hypothetical protein
LSLENTAGRREKKSFKGGFGFVFVCALRRLILMPSEKPFGLKNSLLVLRLSAFSLFFSGSISQKFRRVHSENQCASQTNIVTPFANFVPSLASQSVPARSTEFLTGISFCSTFGT